MSYNPYDLVEMRINGVMIHGRPIEFDAEIADFNKLVDAFGNPVRPKRLSTTCPSCGQGLIIEVCLQDPPFPVIERSCPMCRPDAPPPSDPFNNPLASGQISPHELDPLLHNLNDKLDFQETTVAERMPIADPTEMTNESPSFDPPVISAEDTNVDLIEVLQRNEPQEKKPKKPKKTTKKMSEEVVEPVVEPSPAERLVAEPIEEPATQLVEELAEESEPVETEEPAFDDSDLAEPQ